MKKLIKHIIKWRKRYYQSEKNIQNLAITLEETRKSLRIAKERFNNAINHNVILAREIDSLYKTLNKE